MAFKLRHLQNQGAKLNGSYTFKLEDTACFRLPIAARWDPIPLDMADKMSSCLIKWNREDLKLKVKLRIVVAVDDKKGLPAYSELFGDHHE